MTTATITSKGRITIPAGVRKALKVVAGDRVEFVQIEAGHYLLVAANRSATKLEGMFVKATSAVAIEDMNCAIATEIHRHDSQAETNLPVCNIMRPEAIAKRN